MNFELKSIADEFKDSALLRNINTNINNTTNALNSTVSVVTNTLHETLHNIIDPSKKHENDEYNDTGKNLNIRCARGHYLEPYSHNSNDDSVAGGVAGSVAEYIVKCARCKNDSSNISLYCPLCSYNVCMDCCNYVNRKTYCNQTTDRVLGYQEKNGEYFEESLWMQTIADDKVTHTRHGPAHFYYKKTNRRTNSMWDNGRCIRIFEYKASEAYQINDSSVDRVKELKVLIDLMKNDGHAHAFVDDTHQQHKTIDYDSVISMSKGTIPLKIGDLKQSLKRLDLSNNRDVYGIVPDSIGELYQLAHFDICKTNISGCLPHTLGKLTNLTYLSLSGCAKLERLSVDLMHVLALNQQLEYLYLPPCHSLCNFTDIYELSVSNVYHNKNRLKVVFDLIDDKYPSVTQMFLSLKTIKAIISYGHYITPTTFDKIPVHKQLRYNCMLSFPTEIDHTARISKLMKEQKHDVIHHLKEIIHSNNLYSFNAMFGLWYFITNAIRKFPNEESNLRETCDIVEQAFTPILDSRYFDYNRDALILFLNDTSAAGTLAYDDTFLSKCLNLNFKLPFKSSNLKMLIDELLWDSTITKDYDRHPSPCIYYDKCEKYARSDALYHMLFLPRFNPALMFFYSFVARLAVFITACVASQLPQSFNPTPTPSIDDNMMQLHYSYTFEKAYSILLIQMIGAVGYEHSIGRAGKSTWRFFDGISVLMLSFFFIAYINPTKATTVVSNVTAKRNRFGIIFLAVSLICQSISMLQYFAMFKSISKLIIMLDTMIKNDVKDFLIIFVVYAAGFVVAFTSVFAWDDVGLNNLGTSSLTIISAALGNFDFTAFDSTPVYKQLFGSLMLLLFCIISMVVLLNLLIARMSGTHDVINDKAEEECSSNKALAMKRYLTVHEKKIFSMLQPPFNIILFVINACCGFRHHKYMRVHGISLCGTAANIFLLASTFLPRLLLEYYCFFSYLYLKLKHYKSSINELDRHMHQSSKSITIKEKKPESYKILSRIEFYLYVFYLFILGLVYLVIQEAFMRPYMFRKFLITRVHYDERAGNYKVLCHQAYEDLEDMKDVLQSTSVRNVSIFKGVRIEAPEEDIYEYLKEPIMNRDEIDDIFQQDNEMEILLDLQRRIKCIEDSIKQKK